jgi:hypothetical protein
MLFGRQIEPSPRRSVLDFNDPKVRIELDFALEPLVRLVASDSFPLMRPGKKPLDTGLRRDCQGLWGEAIERRAPVQMVDLHENSASFRGAAPTEDRDHSFRPTSPQVCGDPNVGAQTQWV